MLAQLSAWDLLQLVLVVGFLAALFGWAGGAGARLTFAMRLDRCESYLLQLLNRAKGANGQAAAKVQRERTTSAEREAEDLAEKLAASPRRRAAPISEEDQLVEWEKVARKRGLAVKDA